MKGLNLRRFIFITTVMVVLISLGWRVYWSLTDPQLGLQMAEAEGDVFISEVFVGSRASLMELEAGDVIKKINGTPVNTRAEVVKMFSDPKIRAGILTVEIEREGQAAQKILKPGIFRLPYYYYLFLLVGAIYIFLGLLVHFSRSKYKAAVAWSYFAVLTGGFVGNFGIALPRFEPVFIIFFIISLAELCYSAAFGLHFTLVFPYPNKLLKKKWILPLLYLLPSLVLLFTSLVIAGIALQLFERMVLRQLSGLLSGMIVSFWLLYLLLIVISLVRTYIKSSDINEKKRMRAIIFGTTIPLSILLVIQVLSVGFAFDFPFDTYIFGLIFLTIPVTSFYSIVRYRSMNVEIIIKKGLVYSILTGLLFLSLFGAFLLGFSLLMVMEDVLPRFGTEGSAFHALVTNENFQKLMLAAVSVLIGASFGRIKEKVQNFIDKLFYRQKHNYRKTLENLIQIFQKVRDVESMLDIVADNIEEIAHPQSLAIALVNQDGSAMVRKAVPEAFSQTPLGRKNVESLIAAFGDKIKYLGMSEIREEENSDTGLRSTMVMLGSDICIPLRQNHNITGFFFLGKKKSETNYNVEEINLLFLLAEQASTGVEHARLIHQATEKERLQRELEIGKEIQRSMLPSSLPEIKGVEFSSLSVPAYEVGGDFYSFIQYHSHRVGVVIGDIVGKGVAGALNMAATLSSFKLIAEESASVVGTMQRINRYLVRNRSGRNFAAILFGLVDVERNQFTWSNGGMPDPLLIPATGEIRYLESEFYPLPPGSSANSIFLEMNYDIQKGDTLILVSDGAIEVRHFEDEEEDVFGFAGLLEFFENKRHLKPQVLLEELKAEVIRLRGTDYLDDDFTAIAIRFL